MVSDIAPTAKLEKGCSQLKLHRTMTIKNSKNVLLQDIYVNSTSYSGAPARNTDGADTMFSSNITFLRWNVDNGDDAYAIPSWVSRF